MKPALLLLAILAPSLAFAAEGRLNEPVKPTAERIDLTIDPDDPGYNGTVTIGLNVTDVVERFKLYAQGLTLHQASVSRGKKTWSAEVNPLGGARVVVVPAHKLKPGVYTLKISFENNFTTTPTGLYRFAVGGKHYVASQFEADEARTAWPCFDEPNFKIPWTMHVSAPDNDQVISNMSVAKKTSAGGWQDVTFQASPPLSSYLVALAVGPYKSVPISGMKVPGNVWTLPGTEPQAAFTAKIIPPVLADLEDWFGTPYPYPKLDWVVVPAFAYGAMENPGMVVGRPQASLIDPKNDTPAREREVLHVVSHELSHMWFGDLVTMAWWDDLWLNESFAEWMSAKVVTKLRPKLDEPTEVIESTYRALGADGYGASRPLRTEVDPDHVFETANLRLAYSKGPAVLDMTERWLGPDVFKKGVRAYLAAHAQGNATRDDLIAALHDASGKDVKAMLEPYLDKPGAPMLSFTPQADGKLAVHQTRYAAHGADVKNDTTWQVPVTLRYATDDGTATKSFLMTGTDQTIDLGKPVKWVYPTVDGIGYFAWSEPTDAEKALLADAGTALSSHERLALLLDVQLLVKAGALKYGDALDMVSALQGETDPVVLMQLVHLYSRLTDLAPKDHADVVARVIDTTFRPALDAIGMTPKDGDDPHTLALRSTLLSWLGDKGKDADVIAFSREQTIHFFDNPHSVPPSIAAAILFVTAKNGDPKLQQALLAEADDVKDATLRQELLNAAAAVPGDVANKRVLDLALSPKLLDFMDSMVLIYGVFGEEDQRDAGLAWAMANNAALMAKMPVPFRAHLLQFGGGCSVARAKKAQDFYLAPAHKTPGMDHVAAEVMEHAKACEAEKALDAPSAIAFLDAWAKANPPEPAPDTPPQGKGKGKGKGRKGSSKH